VRSRVLAASGQERICRIFVRPAPSSSSYRLRRLLEETDSCEIIGEAGNGEQALTMAARERPEVVLLDIRMPGMSGIETAHHLNAMTRPPAVVFTTTYDANAVG
jgi:two-component system response regulator AlgR